MTSTQFFFANILKKLGVQRTQKRLLDAADEVHLLKEAQEELGKNVWPKLKDEPKYKNTISEIERLLDEKETLSEQGELLKKQEENLREQQTNNFHSPSPSDVDSETHIQFRQEQSRVNGLKSELASIKSEALRIRREYDKTKSHLANIKASGETDIDIITAQEQQMLSYKETFSELKLQKTELDQELNKAQVVLNKLSHTVKNSHNVKHDSKVEQFKVLGEKNKEISTILSRIGIIDNKIGTLFGDLGKHISLESLEDSNSKKLIKGQFGLCKIMSALRKSINYNHILGGRA